MPWCTLITAWNHNRMLMLSQTSQVHHPTGHCLDTPLPSSPQSHRTVQNRLFNLNRCRFNHTLGFVSHPAQNLDIPAKCDHWTDSLLNTSRRSVLLRNTNLQHDPAVFDLEQTNLSSELPSMRQGSEELGIPMEWRTTNLGSIYHNWCGVDLERK